MDFRIHHHLIYRYDSPVFLEPFTLRLRPRTDPAQQLLAFKLRIRPEPEGHADVIDAAGNIARTVWFTGTHRALSVHTRSRVRINPVNPFNYLVTAPQMLHLPAVCPEPERSTLSAYLKVAEADPQVRDLVQRLVDESANDTMTFLNLALAAVYERCAQIHREEGEPWEAGKTLAQGRGACRDLAVLFNELCRLVGVPARFVSGYRVPALHNATDAPGGADDPPELHAWSEVYLSGAGWRGYDPSAGLATADCHIPIAAAPVPAMAAPTEGAYRKTGAKSTFNFRLVIRPAVQR